jgi:FtsZ-interacting cell division protein ZipA
LLYVARHCIILIVIIIIIIIVGGVWMAKERFRPAEQQFRDCLQVCKKQFGDSDTLTATAMNNLAILLKRHAYAKAIRVKKTDNSQARGSNDQSQGIVIPRCSEIEEAITLYENTVQIRRYLVLHVLLLHSFSVYLVINYVALFVYTL